jgi:acylphosphatase
MQRFIMPELPKTRARITVRGRVQGIGFRAFARAKAIPLLLRGYAKNLPDGSVEVVVEGPKPNIEKFVAELHEGPALATIEDLNVAWGEFKGEFTDFEIRH